MKKTYKAKDIKVIWQPNLCIHAGVCVKTLPKVYKPNEKPWINPEHATDDELINQINQCPSGALSFERMEK